MPQGFSRKEWHDRRGNLWSFVYILTGPIKRRICLSPGPEYSDLFYRVRSWLDLY